ncbi:MAG: hypothetical protein Q8P41_01235 [Pseudomonadota bacterium]|nr:hypothetical protein [Pseudomonadota bacterium]
MGVARSLLKGIKDKLMKNYGERLVSNLADTSSDAPNKFAAPKRDLYDKLKEEGQIDAERQDR